MGQIIDDDYDLVKRCQAGDEKALSELYQKHSKKAVNVAYRKIGDWGAAEEAVQNAWEAVWKNIWKFRFESKFFTWFYRIVINAAYKELRTLKKEPSYRGIAIGVPSRPGAKPLEIPDTSSSTPAENFKRKELREHILKAIQSLPSKYQDVASLHYTKELSHKEIAQILKIKEGTVKSRFFKAKALLRKKLNKKLLEDLL